MFLTFFLSPIGRYIGIAIVATLIISGMYWKVHHDGYVKALADVEKQNRLAKEASEAAGIDVDACYALGAPWVWDLSKSRCIKPQR
jgi:hypothetical protein